jgi:hypothetical protein
MHHDPIPPFVLAAALSACSLQPELLNSERIEQRFGSYGIEIIEQKATLRRSNLYSSNDGVHICRTYAVVKFVGSAATDISGAHEKVLAGESIGTTFKTVGWQINKRTLYMGVLQLNDPNHAIAKLMHLESSTDLALHAYQLVLERETQSFHYATIIEVHHPDYLTENELLELYSTDLDSKPDAGEIILLKQLVLDTN